MTIFYQLTEQEVVRGLIKHRTNGRRLFWGRIGIGVFGLLLLCFGPQLELGSARFFGCVFLSIAVLLLVLSPFRVRRAYTKAVRGNPVFTDPKEVDFDEHGILFASPHRRSELDWKAFVKITQDADYLYLHTDKLGNVVLLPKRAFDEASMAAFLRCTRFPTPP